MELIRLIMLKVEENCDSNNHKELEIDGYTRDEIIYHCKLLRDAGMINYFAEYANGGVYFFCANELTWEGHDFLDEIRDNSKWGKIKKYIVDHGLPISIDALLEVASKVI